ncbi:hypothetical protein EGW08_004088, partial [Elysia chlorotica]
SPISTDATGLRIERITQSLKRKFKKSQGQKSGSSGSEMLVSWGSDTFPADRKLDGWEIQTPLDLCGKRRLQHSTRPIKHNSSLENSSAHDQPDVDQFLSPSLESDGSEFSSTSSDLTCMHADSLTGEKCLMGEQETSLRGSPCNFAVSGKRLVQTGSFNILAHPDTDGEKLFQCRACSKTFSLEVFLELHNKTHVGKHVPNKDEELPSNQTGNSRPTRRKKKQAGDRPYRCEVCGKCFARSTHLVQHRRVHSGEKPYSCDVCGKSFARGVHLSDHKRLHSGERPYVCGHCGKDFSQRSHLTQHMRIHTGEKPYKCGACDRCFTDSSTLNRHKKKHVSGASECVGADFL